MELMPVFDWISLLLVSSIFLGSLVCFLIISHFRNFRLANTLLLMYLGGMCLISTMNFLNHSGLTLYIPWLYRVPAFVYYLIAPSAFLYVKTIVSDDEHLKKWDYLHFIPALLHFLELIPYHLQPLEVKQAIVKATFEDQSLIYALNEGMLPSFWHQFLRSSLALGYAIAMLIKVYNLNQRRKLNVEIPKGTLAWLFVFSFLVMSTSLVVISGSLLKLYFGVTVFQFFTVGICLIFMICLYYMYFHPNILYGVPRIIGGIPKKLLTYKSIPTEPSIELQPALENSEIRKKPALGASMAYRSNPQGSQSDFDYLKHYQPKLEEYLEERKPFLQGGYSIRDMSEDTGIPQHHLSALLNKIYGVRFNDFVNEYRIEYLSQKMATGEFQNLSMDGIAGQAGFGSRGTLFNSIKKLKGVPPTDFFNMSRPGNL